MLLVTLTSKYSFLLPSWIALRVPTMKLEEKFQSIQAQHAPGQEARKRGDWIESLMRGPVMEGVPVDFSHGDVDAFKPTPGAFEAWQSGFESGGEQAYTEYRGDGSIREALAERLAAFTGRQICSNEKLILTPGTQGALFLAFAASITTGTKAAILEPDYFANRKLVQFLGGEMCPIPLHYKDHAAEKGPDLQQLEESFKQGVRVFAFSNPNNPTGIVFPQLTIEAIAELAAKHDVTLIVDQLYSRLLYSGEQFTHLCACPNSPDNVITIMGPSKTESLSGFRLGVAIGPAEMVERMERLQAIVSLRAAGYSQAALRTWFNEPAGWMEQRVAEHEAIRDDLLSVFRDAGLSVATPQAGSYLFPQLPKLEIDLLAFVGLLRHQAKVTVTPGTQFAPHLNSSIRLNFSQDHANAVAAARRIVKMVEAYRR